MPTSLDTYAPFDAGTGANVTEATWRKFMRHMLGSASGVIRGFTNEFAVSGDGSGMNVKAATGECWIRGHYGESTAIKTLTIAASHATLARKDRVVLRADFTNNRVELDVLPGTAAASPVTPAVTQSTTVWETSLAVVNVAAAATSITATAGVVVDDRVYTSAQAEYQLASLSTVDGVMTLMAFNTAPTSASGDIVYDSTTKQFTLQRAGLWVITAKIQYPSNATGKREVQINNGANTVFYTAQTTVPAAGFNSWVSCTAIKRLPLNQAVGIFSYQSSGAAMTPADGAASFVWVGP